MEIELIYNAVLISGVSMVIQLYTPISILYHILFYYGLLQNIEYSSLCCAVGLVAYLSYIYSSVYLLILNS